MIFHERFRFTSTGKVHLGHLETIMVHLQCYPYCIFVNREHVEWTMDPVTCLRCLKMLEREK